MSVSELKKMIDQTIQKISIKVEHEHFFDDHNFKNLLFLDEIINAPHNSQFEQPNLPKYDNATGDPIEHLIDFKNKLILDD